MIGTSMIKPHASGTALQDTCVCLLAYVWPYTKNQIRRHFKFAHMLKLLKIHIQCKLTWWNPHYLTPCWWIYWMRQRTSYCVTQCRWIYWVRETDCVWTDRWCVCEHKHEPELEHGHEPELEHKHEHEHGHEHEHEHEHEHKRGAVNSPRLVRSS